MRARLRAVAPPSGPQYTLFNGAVAVATVAPLWYVFTAVSPSTQSALESTLYDSVSPVCWGVGLSVTGWFGVVASYRHSWTWLGYWVTSLPLAFWVVSLVIGSVVSAHQGDWFAAGKTLGSAILWGTVLRGLLADARVNWVRKGVA